MNNDNIFSKIPDIGYSENALETSFEEFDKIVKSRRSIRVFEPKEIPESVIRKALEHGLNSPNSSNLQPWEFYWLRNNQKKAQIVEACLSQPAARTASEIIFAVARTNTWKKMAKENIKLLESIKAQGTNVPNSAFSYYNHIVPYAYSVGFLGLIGLFKKMSLSIYGLFKPIPREPASTCDMKIWSVKTTALACQTIMLSLRAQGYDTCAMEGFDSSRVKKILNLKRDAVIVMGIAVGKRAPNGVYGPRLRAPKENFIFEV